MILFCITSLSDIMIDLVLEKGNRDDVVVATSRTEDTAALANGFSTTRLFVMPVGERKTRAESDELFAEIALPGLFENSVFDGTKLPVHSVLALDRLKFWFLPSTTEFDFIDNLSFSEAYISIDLGSAIPWVAYLAAKKHGVPVIGVQTEDIRTKEFLDLIKIIDLDSIIVTPDNTDFVQNICDTNVVTRGKTRGGERPAESQVKLELRKGFGIRNGEKVAGILFDKRDEWQCRRWLSENIGTYERTFIIPVDSRASELVQGVLHEYLPWVDIVRDNAILGGCDDIIAFRYYHQELTAYNVIYSDYAGLNRVDELK